MMKLTRSLEQSTLYGCDQYSKLVIQTQKYIGYYRAYSFVYNGSVHDGRILLIGLSFANEMSHLNINQSIYMIVLLYFLFAYSNR